jgi:hypothetical protein
MLPQQPEEALGDLVDLFSEQLDAPHVSRRLRHLARNLDELLFRDESGELAVDRAALIKVGAVRHLGLWAAIAVGSRVPSAQGAGRDESA